MPPHRTEHRSDSLDSHDNTRKRVCKACDRCRLKKSKCDGSSPCSRCKADNAICVFGERKKSQDKVYPKGYVEMLEQQQSQLVAGLRELYSRLQRGENWPGQPLRETSEGHPLTHDILERLDLLQLPNNNSEPHFDGFEEDTARMQQKLIDEGAPYTHRRGSVSSDSEHGHASSSSSYNGTPTTKSFPFDSPFVRNNAPPTPPMNSPFPRQSQIVPSIKQETLVISSEIMTQGALDTSSLSRMGWLNDTSLIEDPIDFGKPMYGFDDFSNYDQNMLVDSIAIVPNDPMMPNWNSSDLDFSTFLQNSVNA